MGEISLVEHFEVIDNCLRATNLQLLHIKKANAVHANRRRREKVDQDVLGGDPGGAEGLDLDIIR